MRWLCFGGSFNPIHNGHLLCARAAAEAAGFARILLIPGGSPPHKPSDASLVSPAHRLAMCRLAAALQPDLFEVDDIETRRSGPSFTLHTARHLKADRGWPEVHWLIGADMLLFLPQWHEPRQLLQEVRFVIVARPGFSIDWGRLAPEYRDLQANVVPVPEIPISSTEIRQRVTANRSIQYLMPEIVADYIRENRLYATSNTASSAG